MTRECMNILVQCDRFIVELRLYNIVPPPPPHTTQQNFTPYLYPQRNIPMLTPHPTPQQNFIPMLYFYTLFASFLFNPSPSAYL